MPLKYTAPAAPGTSAQTPPVPATSAVAPAPSTPGDSTRAQLFNADGSPKPIRNLGALRQQLAGTGGVNPPESKVPETALEPRTQETADGGAEPLSSPQTSPAGTIAPLPDTPTTKRTRRTPAQMAEARAATEAAKASLALRAGQSSAAPSSAGSGAPAPSAGGSANSLASFHTEELVAELVRRVRVLL